MSVHPLMQMILDAFAVPMDAPEPVSLGKYLARSTTNLEPAFPVWGQEDSYAEYAHRWRRQMQQWVNWTLSDFAIQPTDERYALVVLDEAATEQMKPRRLLSHHESRLLESVVRDHFIAKQTLETDDLHERLHRPGNPFRS